MAMYGVHHFSAQCPTALLCCFAGHLAADSLSGPVLVSESMLCPTSVQGTAGAWLLLVPGLLWKVPPALPPVRAAWQLTRAHGAGPLWEPGAGSVTCISHYLIWQRIRDGADTSSADFPEGRLSVAQAVKVQGPLNPAF